MSASSAPTDSFQQVEHLAKVAQRAYEQHRDSEVQPVWSAVVRAVLEACGDQRAQTLREAAGAVARLQPSGNTQLTFEGGTGRAARHLRQMADQAGQEKRS